jgi:hypothetical protein
MPAKAFQTLAKTAILLAGSELAGASGKDSGIRSVSLETN